MTRRHPIDSYVVSSVPVEPEDAGVSAVAAYAIAACLAFVLMLLATGWLAVAFLAAFVACATLAMVIAFHPRGM